MVAAVCFSISTGYDLAMNEVANKIDYCASQIPDQEMGTFYKHGWSGDPKTIYPHAEAFTEYNWARCFRKEFRK